MFGREKIRSLLLSLLILGVFLAVWQIASMPAGGTQVVDDEYAKLVGAAAATGQKSTFPTPVEVGQKLAEQLANPFYDRGANDKGIGIQLAWSVSRVALGFGLAALVAIPLGFVIGMSRLIFNALDPFIQILKPISPLAWMPLALFTLKDSNVSAIFVIFICSIWPMLINTAFGVAAVRKEWMDVSRTLEVKPLRKALLVIVAAEMLVGGTGIGYFVWNEWNNLSISNILVAVFLIGLIGMLLDMGFARLQKAVTYRD
jgi:nitrate/nitrite transport system permease protein